MKKDFQPEQKLGSEPQPIVLPTATDSAKPNVICSQSDISKFCREMSYLEILEKTKLKIRKRKVIEGLPLVFLTSLKRSGLEQKLTVMKSVLVVQT